MRYCHICAIERIPKKEGKKKIYTIRKFYCKKKSRGGVFSALELKIYMKFENRVRNKKEAVLTDSRHCKNLKKGRKVENLH